MNTTAPQHIDEFEAVAEAVPGVVLIARDRNCREVIGNRAACRLFRIIPGTNLSAWQPQPSLHYRFCRDGVELEPHQMPLQRAAYGETLNGCELEVHFEDGSVRYLHGNAMPLFDACGEPRGAVAAYTELTEYRQAEEALRDSEAKLRFTLQAAQIGTWHWDIATGAVQWSDNLERIHEMAPGSFGATFEAFLQRVHPDQREHVLATINRALAEGDDYRIEYRENREDGAAKWIEGRGRVTHDAAGQAAGLSGIAMDVSERKRAEEALRESEGRLRFTLEAARVGTWRWDMETGEVDWSANLEAIYGVPDGFFDGTVKGFLRGVHPDDREEVQEAIQAAVEKGREYWIEHRVLRPDATISWLECRGRVERDAEGNPVRMTGICMDASERKHAEERLRALARAGTALASSLDYETALKQVADMIVPDWGDWCVIDLLNDSGELESVAVAHADPAQLQHTRQLRREYPSQLDAPTGVGYVVRTGESICSVIDEREIQQVAVDERHADLLRSLGLGSVAVVPLVARGRTLGALTLVGAAGGRPYAEGDLPHIQELARRCAFAVDNARLYRDAQRELAERKRTEGELKRLNEKLEQHVAERTALAEQRTKQLRNLAGELSHAEQRERRRLAQSLHDDHQQLLIAAKLRLGMLPEPDAAQCEAIEKVDQLLEDAVQSARTVSRELSPAVLYDAGLAAALRWLATIKQEKYGLQVHVEADADADPGAEDVSIFLYQAVRELLLNTVKHADTEEAWVRMTTAQEDHVLIEVHDHGRGFDHTRMFDEQADAGQFGLFGMRERLALLDGTLSVESVPDDGTRVRMLTPRSGQAARSAAGSQKSVRISQVREPRGDGEAVIRVLLADDHKMLRDGLAGLLEAESDIELVGQAEDGEQALALAQELRPDVVVMDISMPRVNGLQATRHLRENQPEIAIVGLSMHDNVEMAEAMRNAGAATYLTKSGAAGGLVSAIRAHGGSGRRDH